MSNLIRDLIGVLKEKLDPPDLDQLVIFGSAAMVLNGVDIQRPVDDLDVFVSPTLFNKLARKFGTQYKPAKEGGEIPFVSFGQDPIEILATFPGVEYADVMNQATIGEDGIRIGSLLHLKCWKKVQGREKDLADVQAIERQEASRK